MSAAPLPRQNVRGRQRRLTQQRRVPDAFRRPRPRAQIYRQPNAHLDASGGGPAHFDGASHVKRNPERYAVHGCYHQLTSCGMCAGALKVFWKSRRWAIGGPAVEGARLTTSVRVLRKRRDVVEFVGEVSEEFLEGSIQETHINSIPAENARSEDGFGAAFGTTASPQTQRGPGINWMIFTRYVIRRRTPNHNNTKKQQEKRKIVRCK